MSPHLSTLALHALRYGELGDSEKQAALAHLEACGICRRRLAHQERVREEFLLQPVPESIDAMRTASARAHSPTS